MLDTANNAPVQNESISRVTPLLIPKGQNSNSIILPLIASLSNLDDNRWLTWITFRHPTPQQLLLLGANANKLRIIHTNTSTDSRWVLWEALAKYGSHTVVCDLSTFSNQDLIALEEAAKHTNTNAIITKSSDMAQIVASL